MTHSSTITPLSRVKPKTRCPKCKSNRIERHSTADHVLRSNDSGALFSVTEACIMCGWVRVIENVEMGA